MILQHQQAALMKDRRSERPVQDFARNHGQMWLEVRCICGLVSVLTDGCGTATEGSYRHTSYETTISSIPDNVLLEIFNFCRSDRELHKFPFNTLWDWHRLAHVCQRWRRIIFSSPRSLDLQLFCTHGTPVRKNLGSWPRIPLIIDYYFDTYWDVANHEGSDEDNVLAALEHSERVCFLGISMTTSSLERMVMAMRKPFPELTHLFLSSSPAPHAPLLPDEFLAGSAPELRAMELIGISYQMLPTFLLSARRLVDLRLFNIPSYDHFSPEVMVTTLAALTELTTLF